MLPWPLTGSKVAYDNFMKDCEMEVCYGLSYTQYMEQIIATLMDSPEDMVAQKAITNNVNNNQGETAWVAGNNAPMQPPLLVSTLSNLHIASVKKIKIKILNADEYLNIVKTVSST